MSRHLEVAVGVVVRADGRVLLGQRVAGKPYAGWWEFPGGKIEAGESVAQALARELEEELGLMVSASHPWLVREHHYPHADVRLHFRRIIGAWGDFSGDPQAREGQAFDWLDPDQPGHSPLLPASVPVLEWLRMPTVIRLVRGGEGAERAVGQAWGPQGSPGLGPHADGWTALLLTGAQLRSLPQRPDAPICGARCESADDLRRAGELALDFVVTSFMVDEPPLPIYREQPADVFSGNQDDGSIRRALQQAIRSGAHGIADTGGGPAPV